MGIPYTHVLVFFNRPSMESVCVAAVDQWDHHIIKTKRLIGNERAERTDQPVQDPIESRANCENARESDQEKIKQFESELKTARQHMEAQNSRINDLTKCMMCFPINAIAHSVHTISRGCGRR